MIDHTLALIAFRARFSALEICTTGSATLAATTTGFTRSAGSFVTDGFARGMEVTSSGFSTAANNGKGTITAVTALAMTVTKQALGTDSTTGLPTVIAGTANVAEDAAAARTIVAGLPMLVAYENTSIKPAVGALYVSEDYVPAGLTLASWPAIGGSAEDRGLYFLNWFGIAGQGSAAIMRSTDALLRRFTPGTVLTLSDGTKLRIRGVRSGDASPRGGQITPLDGGHWAFRQLEIPWTAETVNAIAA